MELVSVHLPIPDLLEIEKLVSQGFYPNRSELIRVAVRDLIKQEYYKEKQRELLKLKTELGLAY